MRRLIGRVSMDDFPGRSVLYGVVRHARFSSEHRPQENPLVVVRVVVVRQSDEDIRLVGQEVQSASVERNLGLAAARRHVRSAVVVKLLDRQFVLNAHVVTSFVTATLPPQQISE
jgi:hypothetical protein